LFGLKVWRLKSVWNEWDVCERLNGHTHTHLNSFRLSDRRKKSFENKRLYSFERRIPSNIPKSVFQKQKINQLNERKRRRISTSPLEWRQKRRFAHTYQRSWVYQLIDIIIWERLDLSFELMKVTNKKTRQRTYHFIVLVLSLFNIRIPQNVIFWKFIWPSWNCFHHTKTGKNWSKRQRGLKRRNNNYWKEGY
jgi:hypothetical protein